ncbi:MAG TPA: CehA/McbA family metallohydrolase [Candidatus Lokiarchaeia archaeon]|nr:CehA/McbA family metallohydrolase [Candidatus Lokiarchaeia archaeon]
MFLSLIAILVEFIVFLVFLVLFVAACIMYYYNMRTKWQYSDDDFHWRFPVQEITSVHYNVLLDQHVHTIYKGGNLTIRQNIRWHVANGYNALFLTEHNCIQPEAEFEAIIQEFAGQVVILQGMEWTTERIHMNFLGIKEWTAPIPEHPSDQDIQEAIQAAHDQEALVVVNHPHEQAKKAADHPSFSDLASWGVDYIEIASQGFFDAKAARLCGKDPGSKFGAIAGTDIHFPIPVNCWTALNVASFTREAIMDELRAKLTEVIYYEKGTPDFTTRLIPRKMHKMALFMSIGKIFCTVNRSQLEIHWNMAGKVLLLLAGLFWLLQVLAAFILIFF